MAAASESPILIEAAYHISLLLQVSKIAKDQGDHSLSSDLVERALFTFGRATSSLFATKLSQGKARLDFSRPENREFWLAGWHYIKSLVMKGTYRTALEWAKLLLSLDPQGDPYCIQFMIHNLALRAQESKWLLDFAGDENDMIPLLPIKSNPHEHSTPSIAFAALQLRQGAKCRELLTKSMEKVPWLFFRLFKELNLDAPPSIWGAEPRTNAEHLFTEIQVLQTKDLWDTPEATALLMEIAHTIPKVEASSIEIVDDGAMTLNVVRYVYLDNTPALMALVPSNLLHRSNNSDSDPLPPDYNTFSYESQRLTLEPAQSRTSRDEILERIFPGLLRAVAGRGRDPTREEADADSVTSDDVAAWETDESEGIEGVENEEFERPLAPSLTRRLLDMIFGGNRDSSDDEYEDDDEYSANGTATDTSMPGLVNQDGQPEEDEATDDEMPGMVQQ
jgi:hypothetical protein